MLFSDTRKELECIRATTQFVEKSVDRKLSYEKFLHFKP